MGLRGSQHQSVVVVNWDCHSREYDVNCIVTWSDSRPALLYVCIVISVKACL